MFKTIYYKYIFTILVGIIITHLTFSYFMASYTSFFYHDFMMNVRDLDKSEVDGMSEAYLSYIKRSPNPIILIIGSSFSYGYGLIAKDVYSRLLSKKFPNYNIMNASVIGDCERILKKVKYLKSKKLRVDTLIIELNLFNLISSQNNKSITSVSGDFREKYAEITNSLIDSYFIFYLLHPHGFNSISNIDLNYLYHIGGHAEKKFKFVPLPDSYSQNYTEFKKNFSKYKKLITDILASSSEVSKNVYFFVSPIYGDGVKKTQFKLEDIEKELQDLNQICQQMPGINCLNPGIQFSESYFSNLSHYSEEGHRAFSKWLTQKLYRSSQNYLASN